MNTCSHMCFLSETQQVMFIVVIPLCTELYLQQYENAMVESGILYNETLIFDILSLESEVNDACRYINLRQYNYV